jgi:cytoplasmic iron level regulating protein YaaA (DUF328/UPF0246 family)
MILVISPAKRLDFKRKDPVVKGEKPLFLSKAAEIMDELKPFTPQQLSKLLSLGEKLAQASWERHQNWSADCAGKVCRPAVYAYRGDVYQGMQPEHFTAEQNRYMEAHLRILSSLYGILRPFDLIQPYRLQMDTPLTVQGHKDLYSFWSLKVNQYLAGLVNKEPDRSLINLASDEYFRVIDSGKIPGRIIKPVFKEYANGTYKVVSFHAKRARGMMCRFIIENRLTNPEHVKLFDSGNYLFSPEHSGRDEWVFHRG